MSRSARLFLAAVAVLGLIQAPAQAFDGPGCGGDWSGSARCTLQPRGLPVTVYGDASASSGTASVRVWLSPAGSPEVVLLECTGSAGGFATCSNDLPDDRLGNLPSQVQLSLQCNVSGRGIGLYRCTSGDRTG